MSIHQSARGFRDALFTHVQVPSGGSDVNGSRLTVVARCLFKVKAAWEVEEEREGRRVEVKGGGVAGSFSGAQHRTSLRGAKTHEAERHETWTSQFHQSPGLPIPTQSGGNVA